MSAEDKCRPQIVRAFEKDQWHVDSQPYSIRIRGRKLPLYVDIQADKGDDVIIVSEIKCFYANTSEEVYTALGQYLVYRNLMQQYGINYPIYLAVPTPAYQGILQQLGMGVIQETHIKVIVVDLENEVIERWIE